MIRTCLLLQPSQILGNERDGWLVVSERKRKTACQSKAYAMDCTESTTRDRPMVRLVLIMSSFTEPLIAPFAAHRTHRDCVSSELDGSVLLIQKASLDRWLGPA